MRFMLVDDEPVFQVGLREVLCGLRIPHEFQEYKQLPIPLTREATYQVDVLLYSVGKSCHKHTPLLNQFRKYNQSIKIILLSTSPSRTQLKAASEFGVHGYISKNASVDAFLDLVARVLTVDTIITSIPNLTELEEAGLVHLRADENTVKLTQNEVSILHAIAEGARTDEIAKKHHWSYSKTKKCIQQVLQKMQAPSRPLAVVKALHQGII
ncbi:MAG: response regulator transcription factor [Chloroflexi bacterium]|nr:response regulator transcription factor [Chloroflexota bacterium]